ncbi:siroheme synthase [Amanita rubescens]|nr:siroheme synthase [Amanita rubescens]
MAGDSLLIAWQLKDKNVLIVGGGDVAAQRINSILATDAHITLVAPSDGLNQRTHHFIAAHPTRITYLDRLFSGADELKNADMVLTALDDAEVSREIVELCRAERIPVNAADIPHLCDFYFGAQIKDGPLQIMISTNGNGPRMASLIKDKLKKGLTGVEGSAIQKVGELRELLKERAPGIGGEVGRRRMKWISNLCNAWEMDNLVLLDKPMMLRLLDEGWERNTVPTLQDMGGRSNHYQKMIYDSFAKETIYPLAVGIVVGALFTALN